jgi:hypothetical protein
MRILFSSSALQRMGRAAERLQTGAAASPSEQNRLSPGFGRGMMRGRMMGEAAGNSEGGMMAGGGAGMLRRRLMGKRAEEQHEKSDSGGDAAYNHLSGLHGGAWLFSGIGTRTSALSARPAWTKVRVMCLYFHP